MSVGPGDMPPSWESEFVDPPHHHSLVPPDLFRRRQWGWVPLHPFSDYFKLKEIFYSFVSERDLCGQFEDFLRWDLEGSP